MKQAVASLRRVTDAMRQPWTLDHLVRAQWSITNRSGYTARLVTFTAYGALIISGRRDWTATVDELHDRQGYGLTGMSAWGSTFNMPEICVTWFSDHQPDCMRVVTLQWPASGTSLPGGAREARLST